PPLLSCPLPYTPLFRSRPSIARITSPPGRTVTPSITRWLEPCFSPARAAPVPDSTRTISAPRDTDRPSACASDGVRSTVRTPTRSEEHTAELQSHLKLV